MALDTSGVDEMLRNSDLAKEEEIARMELGARPRAFAFAFSRTGRYATVLDVRGVVRRLRLRTIDLVAQVCKRLRANQWAAGWSHFKPAEDCRPTCEKLPRARPERQ